MNNKNTHKKWLHRGLIFIFLLSGLGTSAVIYSASEQKEAKSKPLVVLLPHQDDEMFLGGTISRFVRSGRTVYTVLITDGSGSVIRHVLNGKHPNGKPAHSVVKKGYLNPAAEGYKPLDKQAFSAARNLEYFESMQKLGVESTRVRFSNPGDILGSQNAIYKDGYLTPELATTAISQIYNEVGDGIYIAVASDLEENIYRNPDHLAIENALKKFPNISEKYYFADKEYPGITIYLNKRELKIKQEALKAYSVWDPKNNRFAIGAHSVPKMLEYWHNSHIEYLLPDPNNKTNTVE